jgi:ferredoxin--NADP+ reductase
MIRPTHVTAAAAVIERQVHQSLRTMQAPGLAVVRSSRVCTAGPKASAFVRHIELELQDADLVGAFQAGQCIGVMPPGQDEFGRPLTPRLFSLASPSAGEDGAGRVVSLTVKRLLAEDAGTQRLRVGVASNYLCDLAPGQSVRVIGPIGRRLVLPANSGEFNYVLLATGTGIAPLRGIAMDLLAAGHSRPIQLYAGAAYATDLLYHRQFAEAAQHHAQFRYVPVVSRHGQSDGSPAMYVHQRLLLDRGEVVQLLADPRTILYVCGIAGMELGVYQALATLLSADVAAGYLRLRSPDLLSQISEWSRDTLRSDVRPAQRLRVEVY